MSTATTNTDKNTKFQENVARLERRRLNIQSLQGGIDDPQTVRAWKETIRNMLSTMKEISKTLEGEHLLDITRDDLNGDLDNILQRLTREQEQLLQKWRGLEEAANVCRKTTAE